MVWIASNLRGSTPILEAGGGGGGGGGLSFTIGVSTNVPILWVSFSAFWYIDDPFFFYKFGVKMTPFFPFSV